MPSAIAASCSGLCSQGHGTLLGQEAPFLTEVNRNASGNMIWMCHVFPISAARARIFLSRVRKCVAPIRTASATC
jgi:hypothetical protein